VAEVKKGQKRKGDVGKTQSDARGLVKKGRSRGTSPDKCEKVKDSEKPMTAREPYKPKEGGKLGTAGGGCWAGENWNHTDRKASHKKTGRRIRHVLNQSTPTRFTETKIGRRGERSNDRKGEKRKNSIKKNSPEKANCTAKTKYWGRDPEKGKKVTGQKRTRSVKPEKVLNCWWTPVLFRAPT